MKTIILSITTILIFILTSCKTNDTQKIVKNKKDIPFEIAKNYFVKNTVENNLLNLKISTQEDFEKYFGMATTMSKNGKPSPVNFSTQYVIAIVNKEAEKNINIAPQSLIQNEGNITLTYSITEGENQSYTSRTALILIIDNKYSEDLIFVKK